MESKEITTQLKLAFNKCNIEYELICYKLEKFISNAKDLVLCNVLNDTIDESAVEKLENIYEKFRHINEQIEKLANSTSNRTEDVKNISIKKKAETFKKNLVSAATAPIAMPKVIEEKSHIASDEFPGSCFTYFINNLQQYIPGYAGECVIVNNKIEKEDYFYIINLENLKDIDCKKEHRYTTLPNHGEIFGIILDGWTFRAVRQNVNPASVNDICIYTIDSGDVLNISLKNDELYYLSERDRLRPATAMLCKLNKNSLKYKQSKAFLMAGLGERFCFRVLKKEKYIIEIELTKIDDQSSDKTQQLKEPEIIKNVNYLTHEERIQLFEEPKGTQNAMEAVMGYGPKDDQTICKFYNPITNACFKGTNCKFLHEAKLEDGWTRDKEEIRTAISMRRRNYNIGERIKVCITQVVSVEKLYVHIIEKNVNVFAPTLKELNQSINEFAPTLKKMQILPCELQLVIAHFSDGNWYRSRVLEIDVDNNIKVKVFYVDYGNISIVTMDDLRLWDDRFDTLPFQAVLCHLSNITRIIENHYKGIEFLGKFNSIYEAEIVVNEDEYDDDLLTLKMFDSNNIDISEYLIKHKFAKLIIQEKRTTHESESIKMTNPFKAMKKGEPIYKPG